MCLERIVAYVHSNPNLVGFEHTIDGEGHEGLLVPIPIRPKKRAAILVSEINGEIYLQISLEIGSQGQRLDLRELSPECLNCIRDVFNDYHRQRRPVVPHDDDEGNLGLKTFFTCLSSEGDIIKLFESARSQIRNFIIHGIKGLLQEILERCSCLEEGFEGEFRDIERLELVSGD